MLNTEISRSEAAGLTAATGLCDGTSRSMRNGGADEKPAEPPHKYTGAGLRHWGSLPADRLQRPGSGIR